MSRASVSSRVHRAVFLLIAGAAVLLSTTLASARIEGIAASACTGCHGASGAQVSIEADNPDIEPGETVTLTITIDGDNIQGGGFYLSSQSEGSFTVLAGEGTELNGSGLSHSTRKNAVNGAVTFRTSWTAPSEPGMTYFLVGALAANNDGQRGGDQAGEAELYLPYGCEAKTVYRDYDSDGYGDADVMGLDCDSSPAWALASGDCDQNNPNIHPNASEVCNLVDDDCDGIVDEDLADVTVYRDNDGDGYGVATETAIGCGADPNFAGNPDDCDDTAALRHPNARELCNTVDDDCDGEADEGLVVECGVGSCRSQAESCFVSECIPRDPTAETCNGLDDDCNGLADDGELCPQGMYCIDAVCSTLAVAPPGADAGSLPRPGTSGPAPDPESDAESPQQSPSSNPSAADATPGSEPQPPGLVDGAGPAQNPSATSGGCAIGRPRAVRGSSAAVAAIIALVLCRLLPSRWRRTRVEDRNARLAGAAPDLALRRNDHQT